MFRPAAFAATRPFRDAGFAVMTPTLRGENGNPGRFELLRGELDDARAAARWLAARPEVDGARVYAFGHSIGGGVAAMLSLFDDVTLARTGSCGGLYVPETFARWAESRSNRRLIRFDPQDRREREMRVLGPHVADMVHEHVAYIGDEDPWFIENAAAIQARAQAVGAPLTIERVPGDHMSSLAPALEGFLQRARADA
ncbi:MAG: prolyl oligopeptidase family serine peptidase [Myxococcales bacterium]|nr:prolyl oligopeptidase family serine peptidase [Myxococcales bacterium]